MSSAAGGHDDQSSRHGCQRDERQRDPEPGLFVARQGESACRLRPSFLRRLMSLLFQLTAVLGGLFRLVRIRHRVLPLVLTYCDARPPDMDYAAA
jgi:hypothetical protein